MSINYCIFHFPTEAHTAQKPQTSIYENRETHVQLSLMMTADLQRNFKFSNENLILSEIFISANAAALKRARKRSFNGYYKRSILKIIWLS